jgi:cation/acetate symporter
VSLLAKLDQVVTDLGFGKYTTTTAGSTLNMFVYTLSLMIGTAGLPHVIMRFFTVPTVKDARSARPAGRWCSSPSSTPRHRPWRRWPSYNLHAHGQHRGQSGGDLYAPEASLKHAKIVRTG